MTIEVPTRDRYAFAVENEDSRVVSDFVVPNFPPPRLAMSNSVVASPVVASPVVSDTPEQAESRGRMNGVLDPVAACLDPVTLAELADEAALLKRVDRKYMASVEQAAALVTRLGLEGARALEIDDLRSFRYLSDYFDTAERSLHHAAATKRRRRFKVRERIYLDSGLHFMELKTRGGRGMNVKDRLQLEKVGPAACRVLGEGYLLPYSFCLDGTEAGQWLASQLEEYEVVPWGDGERQVAELVPTARTCYTRTTLLLPEASRLTIDTELCVAPLYGDKDVSEMPFVVIETKSNGRSSAADRLLWSWGIRPMKVSKSGLAMALGHDGQANKWTRALRSVNPEYGYPAFQGASHVARI